MSAKKERIKCTDLSLAFPHPVASQLDIDPELRLRTRGKISAVDTQIDQSKRSCINELPIVPWSAPSGENEILK